MGWLYGWETRAALVKHLCDEPKTYRTLAHKTTKEDGQSILWAVHEFPMDSAVEEYRGKRFIVCYLMNGRRDDRYQHGYKDMGESAGPYFYSCPLRYLEMAPEVACQEWRDNVKAYHARMSRKFKVGDVLKLVSGCTPQQIEVTSVRPFRGRGDDGIVYRVTKRQIA
jgi:hypothetical protein